MPRYTDMLYLSTDLSTYSKQKNSGTFFNVKQI